MAIFVDIYYGTFALNYLKSGEIKIQVLVSLNY